MHILQNQNGFFLAKSKEWVNGRDARLLYRTPHKDEALNELFEANNRDHTLRIKILFVDKNAKGLPIIPEEILPILSAEQVNDADLCRHHDIPEENIADDNVLEDNALEDNIFEGKTTDNSAQESSSILKIPNEHV